MGRRFKGYSHAVVARSGDWKGRIGKILGVDIGPTTVWVTLEIDGLELMFDARELRPMGLPKPRGEAVRRG